VVNGLTTFGICAVEALATILSPDTRGKSLDDLEARKPETDAAEPATVRESGTAR
jgi:hypothetical protein